MKSPERDTTSSAVTATPPNWSDPFRKSKITQYSPRSKFILFSSVSDKTYVTITASTTSQTTPHYQKKEDQQEQFLDNIDHQYKYRFGFRQVFSTLLALTHYKLCRNKY